MNVKIEFNLYYFIWLLVGLMFGLLLGAVLFYYSPSYCDIDTLKACDVANIELTYETERLQKEHQNLINCIAINTTCNYIKQDNGWGCNNNSIMPSCIKEIKNDSSTYGVLEVTWDNETMYEIETHTNGVCDITGLEICSEIIEQPGNIPMSVQAKKKIDCDGYGIYEAFVITKPANENSYWNIQDCYLIDEVG